MAIIVDMDLPRRAARGVGASNRGVPRSAPGRALNPQTAIPSPSTQAARASSMLYAGRQGLPILCAFVEFFIICIPFGHSRPRKIVPGERRINWHNFCDQPNTHRCAACIQGELDCPRAAGAQRAYLGEGQMAVELALIAAPKWLDTGNNAWQLAAATFVGLQSIPGLTVLYGGIVKKKWAINSAFMSIYAFASVLVVWVLFDYNMAFGPQWFPFLGKPMLATSASFSLGQAVDSGGGRGHASFDLPDGDVDVLPVRVRRDHRDHSCRIVARAHEFHRLDDLLSGVDDAGLYGRGLQPVGRRLARRHGRRGLLGRLRHPSGGRNIGLRRGCGDRSATASRPRSFPAKQSCW